MEKLITPFFIAIYWCRNMSEENGKINIFEFVEKEYERITQEQKQRFGAPILRIEEQKVYDLVVDPNAEWKRINTKYGERVVIPVVYEGSEYVLMMNPNGSVYRTIIEQLAKKLRETGGEKIKTIHIMIKRQDRRYTVFVDVETEPTQQKRRK